MKPGKALGPDGLPIETLKVAGSAATVFVAEILNASYSLHKSVGIGEGILRALQKPSKPVRPFAYLRPIILLTMLRKILSLIVLNRIRTRVDKYT